MSIVKIKEEVEKKLEKYKKEHRTTQGAFESQIAAYKPDKDQQDVILDVVKKFTDGYTILQTPRLEWNDLSTIDRMGVDQLMWNTYQPNDGDPIEGDPVNSWKSRAMKPITRNKVISIAAHSTSRLLFPKVFAYSYTDEEQQEAAQVMSDIMAWTGDQFDYPYLALHAVISALVNPASIVYTGFEEYYHQVKRPKTDDQGAILMNEGEIEYENKTELDEDLSGFQAQVVPVDEFFISDIYQNNVQKQDFIIWRRVMNYDLAKAKYAGKYTDFEYVKPGVQTIYVDANQGWYNLYDPNMQKNEVEEVMYWNKRKDLFIIIVNGILLTKFDNPNPRNDKQYPFAKFVYEPIDEGRFFFGKSLVFKLAPDYRVVNTLYPMIIDGTYLNIFQPMVATGTEVIGSDVIVPGAVTTLADKDARLVPLSTATDISAGMQTLFKVEQSINESSEVPSTGANKPQGGKMTAYEISKLEQNNAIVLGLFMTMISSFVKQFGKLLVGDILQYMTIPEVKFIEGKESMAYRSFFMPEQMSDNEMKTKKISFDDSIPDDPMSEKEMENRSFDMLDEEGGLESDLELSKVNPTLFRNLKYILKVTPDVLSPMTEEAERAFDLETYDRAINNQGLDQNEVTKTFLLSTNPKSKRNPSKFFKKEQQGGTQSPLNQNSMQGAIMDKGGAPAPVAEMG